MFNTIVVGIDGSEMAENALRIACDLAWKYDSEICLVHTPQPKTAAFALGATTGYHAVTTMPSPADVKKATEKVINSGIKIAKEMGLDITKTHTKMGSPANEIIAFAEECDADLIVTGRRGLGSLSAILQGSTTQQIGQSAKCACLSVV